MSGFVEGIDRSQSSLFPAYLEDYVAEDNPVRAVDTFVEGLELGKLGFDAASRSVRQSFIYFSPQQVAPRRRECGRQFLGVGHVALSPAMKKGTTIIAGVYLLQRRANF